MIRLADRCSLLVAGALLGFAAARAGDPGPGPEPVPATPSSVVAAAAGLARTPPATRPRTDPGPPTGSIDEALPPGIVPRTRAATAAAGPLTDDEIDRCLLVARDVNPDLHAGLLALREADPEQFRSQLASSARLRALARLERDTPHVYQLKIIELRNGRTVRRLIADLQDAARSDDDTALAPIIERLRTEMRIEQAFRLLGRKEYLDQLRDRLERLESDYRNDVTTVDERIQTRIESIIEAARSGGGDAAVKTPPGAPRRGPGDGTVAEPGPADDDAGSRRPPRPAP